MKRTLTLEFEVELDDDDGENMQGVQLHVMRKGEWKSECLFMMGNMTEQKVREGKHLVFHGEKACLIKDKGV